ncbi:MAG: single-stranded DNA-binding protein [Clostridia bacterium]|nr:single-stranded DNA-binding protein [Clostridia bacterium]
MNKLTIIGNLTRDPELRQVGEDKTVCNLTVAVNGRGRDSHPTYFRVSVWNGLGETCEQYLRKGSKVAVTGRVDVSTYQSSDGTTKASLDVLAEDVEFLTPKAQ